jgi:Flp pilus assembly protein TadG
MRTRLNAVAGKLRRLAASFYTGRDGNVAVLTAFILILCIFAVGMGVDYTFARQRQDQIDGFADAAVLAAVSPNMMPVTHTTVETVATNQFLAQLATLQPSVSYGPADVQVTVTDTVLGATGINRTAVLKYSANSNNIFSGVLGMQSLPLSGTSTSTNGVSPQINFYLLLDTSPSMEIAATTAGISTMVAATSPQGGCAFGCHETNPTADNLQNPKETSCVSGGPYKTGGEDNYALARCLGVTLRIDLVNQAVQNFMTYAPQTATANNTNYQVAVYTMDYSLNNLQAMTSNFAQAATATANLSALTVYDNSCLTQTNCNNDEDSYLDTSLKNINTAMPNPGNGTSNAGDSPQEVLFIVSDGVNDYASGSSRKINAINSLSTWCQTIKNRGIRIAFLYTTYNPLPTNAFYNANVASFQPNIATDAQNCASPGLYYQVSTDGDISAALQSLFQEAVATAYLKQ